MLGTETVSSPRTAGIYNYRTISLESLLIKRKSVSLLSYFIQNSYVTSLGSSFVWYWLLIFSILSSTLKGFTLLSSNKSTKLYFHYFTMNAKGLLITTQMEHTYSLGTLFCDVFFFHLRPSTVHIPFIISF